MIQIPDPANKFKPKTSAENKSLVNENLFTNRINRCRISVAARSSNITPMIFTI